MTILQLFVGDIYSLLNFMSFLRWLFIGVVVLGLIYLRYTKPDLPRPFKVSVSTTVHNNSCTKSYLDLCHNINHDMGYSPSVSTVSPSYSCFIWITYSIKKSNTL